jgi:hypothetical protein
MDGGDPCLGGHHTGKRLDEGFHPAAIQPPKVEQLPLAHQLRHRLADAQQPISHHLAEGPHHQQPGAAKVPRQKLQQQQGRVIGRMQIVQDQQQRLHRRRTPEQAGNRLEQVEPRRIGPKRRNRGDRRRSKALGETRDQLGDMGRPRTQPGGKSLLVAVFGEAADHLAPRPERRCAPTRPAAPPQDADPAPHCAFRQVLGEPGLADPRLPSDQEQPPPTPDRSVQAGHQLRHFPVPAHKGPRSLTPGRVPHPSHRASQPSARHARRVPLVHPGPGSTHPGPIPLNHHPNQQVLRSYTPDPTPRSSGNSDSREPAP